VALVVAQALWTSWWAWLRQASSRRMAFQIAVGAPWRLQEQVVVGHAVQEVTAPVHPARRASPRAG